MLFSLRGCIRHNSYFPRIWPFDSTHPFPLPWLLSGTLLLLFLFQFYFLWLGVKQAVNPDFFSDHLHGIESRDLKWWNFRGTLRFRSDFL